MSVSHTVPTVLVTANRAVVYGTIARWLLHDLRNPTQALSLLAELLGDVGDFDADLHETLRHSARHLTDCVGLLDRALRTMPSSPEPAPVSIATVLTFLCQVYRTRKSAATIDAAQALAAPLPAVASVEDHLEHAVLNLFVNALEALGDREGGRIVVTASATPDRVELVIADNGPGIAPHVQDQLFEPYVTTKTISGRASGLGLTVARYLLESSGGTVAYQPASEAGARFVIGLRPWTQPAA